MTSDLVSDTGLCSALTNGKSRVRERDAMTKKTKHVHWNDFSIRPSPDSDVGKSLSKVYGGRYERWLRSYGVKPSWEMYPDSVEIYLWHGYRPNPSSWSYILKSMFYPTNETLNIWTHFVPFLLMTYRTYNVFTSFEHPTNLIYWPFWIHAFACCNIMLLSVLAHIFYSKSAQAQEFCMCWDYSGIMTFGTTNLIAYELYVFPFKCIFDIGLPVFLYIYLSVILGCVVHFLSCFSRHRSCPKPLIARFAPSIFFSSLTAVPAAIKCYKCVFGETFAANPRDEMICSLGSEKFASTFVFHAFMFLAAALCVIFRFPEKYYPGVFDIVGHSHQFFHIFTAIALFSQNVLVEHILRDIIPLFENGKLATEDMAISEWTTLYPIAIIVIVSFCFSYKFSKFLAQMVQERRNKQA